MQFRTDGYVIQDGGFFLSRGLDTIITVDAGVTATIGARIADGPSGGSPLIKEGAGTLLLGPSNTYSGGTIIRAGILLVDEDVELGQGGPTGGLTFEGGTLAVRGNFNTFRSVTLAEQGGTIDTIGSPATFAGVISGPGTLTKTGGSELVLAGPGNSYAGGTFIDSGIVRVATDNLLGDPTGGLTFDGGTLRAGPGFVSARSVTLVEGGGTLETSGLGATFTGIISGPGRLTTVAPVSRINIDRQQRLRRWHDDRQRHPADRRWRNDRQHCRRRHQQRFADLRPQRRL